MSKSSKTFDEMLRLYQQEYLSLEQISDRFGITRQAVYDRFKRAGVKLRPVSRVRKIYDRETLLKLYEEDNLNVKQIAEKLNAGITKIYAEFKRHSIRRRTSGERQRKHPEFWNMKTGDTLIIPRPQNTQPYCTLYNTAKNAGIKISIKSTENGEVCVTCLGVTGNKQN